MAGHLRPHWEHGGIPRAGRAEQAGRGAVPPQESPERVVPTQDRAKPPPLQITGRPPGKDGPSFSPMHGIGNEPSAVAEGSDTLSNHVTCLITCRGDEDSWVTGSLLT